MSQRDPLENQTIYVADANGTITLWSTENLASEYLAKQIKEWANEMTKQTSGYDNPELKTAIDRFIAKQDDKHILETWGLLVEEFGLQDDYEVALLETTLDSGFSVV